MVSMGSSVTPKTTSFRLHKESCWGVGSMQAASGLSLMEQLIRLTGEDLLLASYHPADRSMIEYEPPLLSRGVASNVEVITLQTHRAQS